MRQIEGLRILHFQSPVRFDSRGVFQHEFDSNYKVLEKTVKFLPKCHHYVVVPEKHNIPDDREMLRLFLLNIQEMFYQIVHTLTEHLLEIYLIFVLWILILYFVINQKNYIIY